MICWEIICWAITTGRLDRSKLHISYYGEMLPQKRFSYFLRNNRSGTQPNMPLYVYIKHRIYTKQVCVKVSYSRLCLILLSLCFVTWTVVWNPSTLSLFYFLYQTIFLNVEHICVSMIWCDLCLLYPWCYNMIIDLW